MVSNRITELFSAKEKNILNIYFTAGFPKLGDTADVLMYLEDAGVDMVEIGMPYSDPLADGPTIQKSGQLALESGMSVELLFEQLDRVRDRVKIPILLMGYINPVLQYGVKEFCASCKDVGIDGTILPDLPMAEYLSDYKDVFEASNLSNIFLVTPQTSDERLKFIDEQSTGFVYVVSTSSTTGNDGVNINSQQDYFERIKSAGLKSPSLIGFNIKDHQTFTSACDYSNGAIIGSAFVKMLQESTDLKGDINRFVKGVLNQPVQA